MNDDQNHPTIIVGKEPQRAAHDSLPWFDGAMRDDASLSVVARPAPARGAAGLHPGLQTGRMQDEGEIARGGMGAVHRLYDTDLRRRVALKVNDPGPATDPEHTQRFIDEARITGALSHPHIVPVHDLVVGEDGRAS